MVAPSRLAHLFGNQLPWCSRRRRRIAQLRRPTLQWHHASAPAIHLARGRDLSGARTRSRRHRQAGRETDKGVLVTCTDDTVSTTTCLIAATASIRHPEAGSSACPSGSALYRQSVCATTSPARRHDWGEVYYGSGTRWGWCPCRPDHVHVLGDGRSPPSRMPPDQLAELMRDRLGDYTGGWGAYGNRSRTPRLWSTSRWSRSLPQPWYRGRQDHQSVMPPTRRRLIRHRGGHGHRGCRVARGLLRRNMITFPPLEESWRVGSSVQIRRGLFGSDRPPGNLEQWNGVINRKPGPASCA